MNSPVRVIGFVNAAHFIDHYSMLIFAAAVIVMGPALGMAYSELLPYATPDFIAFGAGSLLTGWLGDRGSRRHMMVIFFAGIGASMIAVGLVRTPLQLGAALLSIGLFASIYHPVGTAMLVSYADQLGRQMGMNGVWGNLGVASSALVTGVVGQLLGWRWTFIVPGIVTLLIGVAMTQFTIGQLIDRHSLKAVSLPLSLLLAPSLYLAATLSNLPLIVVAIGIIMGIFGQVTVNDAMVGKYTSEEWRSRAYAVRYFVGFTAAGASVGLVAWLYQRGGFVMMLHGFAALCLLVIVAAIILPRETAVPAATAN